MYSHSNVSMVTTQFMHGAVEKTLDAVLAIWPSVTLCAYMPPQKLRDAEPIPVI